MFSRVRLLVVFVFAIFASSAVLLVGAQDALTIPERAHEMAEAIAGAKLVITPDCGHISTLERPDAVNAALEDWLNA